jgi:hypothetical protein
MPLVTRQLDNIGQPLYTPTGALLVGAKVTFTLCNINGQPIDTFDAATGERIVGTTTVTTDVNGEFTVLLWPNDRGTRTTRYACRISPNHQPSFIGAVPTGATPLKWLPFQSAGATLNPTEISALALHMEDDTRHLSVAQNAALDAATTLSGSNPVATIADLSALGGGFTRTAAATLSGHRVVKVDDAGLADYAANTVDDAQSVIGLTTGAVTSGGLATIQSSGLMTEPSWSWVPNNPVYLGSNGTLTQTTPTSGVVLVIGVPLSATELFIDIKTPIALI